MDNSKGSIGQVLLSCCPESVRFVRRANQATWVWEMQRKGTKRTGEEWKGQ